MTIIFKKLKKHIFTFILSLITLSTFSLGTPLSVSFAQNKQSASSGIVTIKITNTSDTAVKVLKWNTPLEKTLSANIFHIQNAKTVIPYIGRLIKRMKPSDDDYIVFEAGEERTLDIALPKYYKMTTKGEYKVTYNATFKLQTSSKKKASKKALKTVATHTTITFIPSQKKSLPAQKVTTNFNQCSQSKISILNAAQDAAILMAQDAYNTMHAAEQNTSGERYNTWFGAPDVMRQSTVTSNFNKIYTALDTKNILFDCSCTGTHIAHVYTTDPYKIHMCPAFWNLSAVGTDSQAGTVVHEMSHFTIVAGTSDHIYGQSGAKALAQSNPAQAIDNADNHEFFAENTPSLGMGDPFTNAQPIADILADLPQADSIDNAGDKDFFKFNVPKTGRYTFHTSGNLDTQGTLYDHTRTALVFHDDIHETNNLNFQLSHVLIKGETYYLRVNAYQKDTGGYTLHSTFMNIVKHDFNGDGSIDILWRYANGRTVIWFMNADGSRKGFKVGSIVSKDYTIKGTNDFNGDGITDILWRHTNGRTVIWFMNPDGSRKGFKVGSIVSKDYTIKGTNDFNADGITDILWRHTNGRTVIWFMNADGSRKGFKVGSIVSKDYTIKGTNDFNADGNTDILWRHTNGRTVIWFMNPDGSRKGFKVGSIVSKDYTIKGTNDFNADGITDILWRHTNGRTVIWFMNADGSRKGFKVGSIVSKDYTIKGTNDFNGDGITDILWRHTNGRTVIWFMNPDGSRKGFKVGSIVSKDYTIKGTNDFNGDGITDILWRHTNGRMIIWFMNPDGSRKGFKVGSIVSKDYTIQ